MMKKTSYILNAPLVFSLLILQLATAFIEYPSRAPANCKLMRDLNSITRQILKKRINKKNELPLKRNFDKRFSFQKTIFYYITLNGDILI